MATNIESMTLADRVYLARYYEIDGPHLMAAALNHPAKALITIVLRMRRNGEYDLYRNLSDEEYEKILNCAEVKNGAIKEHEHK